MYYIYMYIHMYMCMYAYIHTHIYCRSGGKGLGGEGLEEGGEDLGADRAVAIIDIHPDDCDIFDVKHMPGNSHSFCAGVCVYTATHCSTLQHTATRCDTAFALVCVYKCVICCNRAVCNLLQYVAVCSSV